MRKTIQIIFVLFSGAYNGDKDYANCKKVKWNKDVSTQLYEYEELKSVYKLCSGILMFIDQIILRGPVEKCFMVLCPEYPKICSKQ